MKTHCILLISALLPVGLFGQQSKPALDTLLNDANYTFNRYEELSSSATCERLNPQLRQQCGNIIKSKRSPLAEAKKTLSRAMKVKRPTLIDMFDVYTEVQDIAVTLELLSDNFLNFSDDFEFGRTLAQASNKAGLLATEFEIEVRDRIAQTCP